MLESVFLHIKGEVKVFELAHPDQIIYQRKNVICSNTSFLFARLMAASTEPVAGIWGLAIGAGGSAPAWSSEVQPDPTAAQQALVSEIKRKQLSQVQFLDPEGNPTTVITNVVSFLTILNESTDDIEVPIREMGLIGGGTTVSGNGGPSAFIGSSPVPYFNSSAPAYNAAILINYITCPPFVLPAGVDMGIQWTLTF